VPPTVSVSSENPVKALDSSVVIMCSADGNPQPTLTWSRGGQPLISSPQGVRISSKGTRLDIPRLEEAHVGEYTCSARNEAGSADASIHVDVIGEDYMFTQCIINRN
jgi:hypothetical protein